MDNSASPAFWEIRGGRTLGPAPFFIFGIVNVTPDSFFDGGKHDDSSAGVTHGKLLAAQGAHVLDIGGESSRPYAEPVSLDEELARVLPVVKGLKEHKGDNGLPWALSVDTYKAATAVAVLEAGVDIINDISACNFEPELQDVLAQYKPGYVLMHSLGRPEKMQDAPEYDNVVDEILKFFEQKMKQLTNAGLPEERIMLDPGVGFGKTLVHNLEVMRNMKRFASLGRPLMAGISNKSVFGGLLNLGAEERSNATQAATALMASQGVLAHRVHDVKLTEQTLTLTAAFAEGVK